MKGASAEHIAETGLQVRRGAFHRLFLPFLSDAAALLAIRLLFHRNVHLFFVLLAVFSLSLAFRCRAMKAAVAFWAVILGLFGEWACVKAGLWVYAYPTFKGLPLWLGFVWPILMMSFLEMAEYLDETGRRDYPEIYRRCLIVLALVGLLLAGAGLHLAAGPLSLIFFLFLSLAVIFAHRPFHAVLFVLAALIGFSGEFLCVQWGVWHYTSPVFASIGMPASLPLAWGLSALLVWLAARLVANAISRIRRIP